MPEYHIVFEILSAYGAVGLSLGIANVRILFSSRKVFRTHICSAKLCVKWCFPHIIQAHCLRDHRPRAAQGPTRRDRSGCPTSLRDRAQRGRRGNPARYKKPCFTGRRDRLQSSAPVPGKLFRS
jgi:hypothetical protein